MAHVRLYADAVPDRKLTVRRIIADGDSIAVEYDFAGTSAGVMPNLPPQGEPVTASFCTVLRLRGDQAHSQVDHLGG